MTRKAASAPGRFDQWAAWIQRQSRGRRVALSLAITVELVILVSVVVDRLLVDRVTAGDLSRSAPAWIAAGTGVIVYVIGWWALVGFDWNPGQPWRAGKSAVLFTVIGAAALIVLIVLALYGLLFGYLLA
ncbi:MAG: hypothetical protein KatS3mg051_1129 [Anaerolineae bacterium]|nr:MAG: hypothetical protein KatS3mg051_1129 [Anaerolineae bacterium]